MLFAATLAYNLLFHRLAKYPGPLLWRASRLPYSYHQVTGDLYLKIEAMHKRYGSTVRVAPNELSFTAPEAWNDIYGSHLKPQLQKTPYMFPPGDPEKLPDSILTVGDAEHARVRRQIGPAFTGKAMESVEPMMQQYVDLLISQLDKARLEGPQDMTKWLSWTLNDVIGNLAMGVKFDCLANRKYHHWPSFMLMALKAAAVINQLRRFNLWLLIQLVVPKKQIEARDSFVASSVQYTHDRIMREEKQDGSDRSDLIGLLLRETKHEDQPLTELEIAANAATLIAAGSETTSVLLSGLVYYLTKTPTVMKKLQEELRGAFQSSDEITIKTIAKLSYLHLVIEEGLRIFSPAAVVTQRLTPRGGHLIAGQQVPGNVSHFCKTTE